MKQEKETGWVWGEELNRIGSKRESERKTQNTLYTCMKLSNSETGQLENIKRMGRSPRFTILHFIVLENFLLNLLLRIYYLFKCISLNKSSQESDSFCILFEAREHSSLSDLIPLLTPPSWWGSVPLPLLRQSPLAFITALSNLKVTLYMNKFFVTFILSSTCFPLKPVVCFCIKIVCHEMSNLGDADFLRSYLISSG